MRIHSPAFLLTATPLIHRAIGRPVNPDGTVTLHATLDELSGQVKKRLRLVSAPQEIHVGPPCLHFVRAGSVRHAGLVTIVERLRHRTVSVGTRAPSLRMKGRRVHRGARDRHRPAQKLARSRDEVRASRHTFNEMLFPSLRSRSRTLERAPVVQWRGRRTHGNGGPGSIPGGGTNPRYAEAT